MSREKKDTHLSEYEKMNRSKAMIRELTVSKRNDMIQNSRSSLTLREQKAILYMLTKIKPTDSADTEYEFSCLEFAMAIGITGRSKYNYKQIMDMLEKLSSKCWWIVEKKGSTESAKLLRWFNTVHIEDKTKKDPGKIKIKFHEDMAPYVFNLARQKIDKGLFFSTYNYKAIILMKNKYSPQLLEILESYRRNNVEWYFDVKDLQNLLAEVDKNGVSHPPKRWESYANFDKDVLQPAVAEINRYSDLTVNYVTQKRDIRGIAQRSVQRIIFFMAEKTTSEKEGTEQLIVDSMRGHMDDKTREKDRIAHERDEQAYQQMKLEFESEQEEKKRNDDHDRIARRIEKSRYPLLTSLYPEFSDKQIQALYSSSVVNYKLHDSADLNTCEMWVCAYIQTYYDMVKAKSIGKDLYPLLLAYVSRDYNQFADKISV